jgi:hypothetical protein
MNLSPEALERVLTELADRADGDHVGDRVPAIRDRARRAARRRTGALAAVVTVLIVLATGATGFGGLPLLRGEGPDPAKRPAPIKPFLTISLVRDEKTAAMVKPQMGGKIVVVKVTLRGRVPQVSDFDARGGKATDNLRGLLMDWGNGGGQGAEPAEGFGCGAGAPLVDVNTSFLMTTEYVRPGPETVTFKTGACDPIGQVEQKLTFVVE